MAIYFTNLFSKVVREDVERVFFKVDRIFRYRLKLTTPTPLHRFNTESRKSLIKALSLLVELGHASLFSSARSMKTSSVLVKTVDVKYCFVNNACLLLHGRCLSVLFVNFFRFPTIFDSIGGA